ncbi:hypothetical protein RJ639_008319 [Escallonia herrerae]|uniref:DUF4283 domain-containing protein n=1 Tax=Escallonia herrerae TaxID=1293975 RepID=A0AA88VT94_9ASTE|nr:hypothetical protein RJ639_008319 [Escallonia herrerae]
MDDLINKTSSLHCADLDDLIADETSASKEYELTLLAKIISSKQPNPKVVHSILQKAWNPSKGMKLQSHQNNIYSITFSHEWDRNRILASRPWSIMSSHVVVRDWPPHLNLEEIDFSKSSFWIRVTGLPPKLMTKQNATRIGSKIGKVMEVDFTAEGNLAWLRFLRIQVQIDINKPSAYSCGRLGHTNRGCSHPPFEPPENMSSPYGPWLRAESTDTCPRTARWNPLAVTIRATITSGISDLPEQIASDLPESSMPDVPGAILGIHRPPKALTPAPLDQTFDVTKQPRTEIRDSVSNQTPPFFPISRL